MNESQQILFMQIRILRMMAEKYSLSLKQAAEILDNMMCILLSVKDSEFFKLKVMRLCLKR